MKNNSITLFAAVCFLIVSPFAIAAQDTQPRATIDVQGSADVKVVPDQVFLVFGIETSDPDLTVAKAANDERSKNLLALTRELNIDPKYVQTDFINIEPWAHELRDDRQTVRLEYRVRKNIAITLSNVGKFEELLSRALEGGANHVHGIQFRTTELRKHRDHARVMAIQAAREKAILLAASLGRQIGPATHISEYSGGWYSPYSFWGGMGYGSNAMSQVSSQSGEASAGEGTIALGQITVTANVSVSFALQ